ncbi:MAG: hypothetical protein P8Z35_15240 [Ignavibacteriaceae bacterium]|jgi:hypothetical protein
MKYIYQFILPVLILLTFISGSAYSQERISTTFEASPDGKIFIYYQLNGDPEKEYDVSVVLKRTSVPSFELTPSDLSGNIGKGKFGDGSKKTIIWTLKPEEKNILNGEDFYFVVNADEVESGGGIPWYVYVGGAALAGGTAAVLLLNKKSDNTTTTETNFPLPPDRPSQ